MSNLTPKQAAFLAELAEFLENREDADNGIPNEEMRLLMEMREVFEDIK